jgi:hypothetical protein
MKSKTVAATSRREFMGLGLGALIVAGGASLTLPRRAGAQEQPTFQTRARFLHADTDAGEFEVFIDGEGVLDEFGYGDLSDWIEIDPGAVRLTLTADRAGFNWAVFDAVYPITAGNDFNVIFTDILVVGTAVDSSPLLAGSARVRATHASADTPPVDVVVAGTNTALVTGLRFGRSSDYVEVPAGTYDLDVLVSESGEVALSLPGVTVEEGMVYDFVAMGTAGDEQKPLTVTPLASEARTQGTATPSATPEG